MKKGRVGVRCSEASARAFFKTINVDQYTTLSFLGINAKGEILNHPTALRDAFEAGRRLVHV